MQLSWDNLPGAQGYRVYRDEGADSDETGSAEAVAENDHGETSEGSSDEVVEE